MVGCIFCIKETLEIFKRELILENHKIILGLEIYGFRRRQY